MEASRVIHLRVRKIATPELNPSSRSARPATVWMDRAPRTDGGLSGPDLSEIGSRRSLAQLETAVLDPSAEVEPDYWSLRARTKTGESITGIRMNEDMDSFQLLESSGRLRSVMKADLATF